MKWGGKGRMERGHDRTRVLLGDDVRSFKV